MTTAYCGIADLATGERVGAATRFAVGSLAKSMVATAVARLAAEGRLSLDDPACVHVPELRGSAWGEGITLRDLLANRSGLPLRAEHEFSGFAGDEDDALSRVASELAPEEPTTGFWSYTNVGWSLVGRAIETIAARSWEDAMQASLLDPLAMDQTVFASRPIAEPRARSYDITPRGPSAVPPWMPRALGPAGSTILSTVTDLLRFGRSQLDDPALAMLRVTHAEVRIHAWLDAWCLGWARFDWAGGPVWGWDGLVGGYRSVMRILPERHGVIVLLTNGSTGRAMYRSLFADLVNAWFDVTFPQLRLEPSAGAAGDLARYAGTYAWPDRCVDVTAVGDRLVIESERDSSEALPIDATTFLLDAGDPDTPTMTFGGFDADGRPGVLYQMLWGLPRV